MLKPGQLSSAFEVYWNDLDACRRAGAYWSLLHVTLCIPDICAALQSRNGETNGQRYEQWCDRWLKHPLLNGKERWRMRCRVLHEGRASRAGGLGPRATAGRYGGFSFGQPTNGTPDHMRVAGEIIHVDVPSLYEDTRRAVASWASTLETSGRVDAAVNVARNLGTLVRVTSQIVTTQAGGTGPFTMSAYRKTN